MLVYSINFIILREFIIKINIILGIFDAADPKMKEASRLRKNAQGILEFNWDYYKNAAKLKLK